MKAYKDCRFCIDMLLCGHKRAVRTTVNTRLRCSNENCVTRRTMTLRIPSEDTVAMRYDVYMDKECVALCDALNSIEEIRTTESCCGHGKTPFHVHFEADDIRSLRALARCTSHNYYGTSFKVLLSHNDENPCPFLLEGGVGDYAGADKLAKDLREFNEKLKHPPFSNGKVWKKYNET